MQSDKGSGASDEGWTPEEKGNGSPGGAESDGNAGEAKSKGRPSDDRAKTEEAAAETEKPGGEDA